MHKDYGMILAEEIVQEYASAAGGAIGAGVGAAGSAVVWAKKRIALKKKLAECKDDECRTRIKLNIKNLRNRALKYGTAATVAGAGVGAAGKGIGTVVNTAIS